MRTFVVDTLFWLNHASCYEMWLLSFAVDPRPSGSHLGGSSHVLFNLRLDSPAHGSAGKVDLFVSLLVHALM